MQIAQNGCRSSNLLFVVWVERRNFAPKNFLQGENIMTEFVLVYTGGTYPETEEENAQIMEAWGAWMGSLGDALVNGGNPFSPQAKTIGSDGSVTEGAAGTPATGYSIVQANSLDEAVTLAKGCPHWQHDGQISVYETFQM
jgi:hypothetical protein